VIIAYPQSKSNAVRRFSLFSIRSLFVAFCLLLLFVGTGNTGQVTLAWDPQTDPQLMGYRLYYGTQSRNYAMYMDVGNQTTGTIPELQPGQTYYITATAYDTAGLESEYSNEVTYVLQANCTYSISPASQSLSSSGGRGSITVTTQANCSWAASGAAWITITSGASGVGNGVVGYSVPANNDTSSRTAATSIAGQIFTVTQAAAPPAPSSYTIAASGGPGGSISPSGSMVVASGTSQTFTFTADTGYKIKNVLVDGQTLKAVSSYTFSRVTSNHAISVAFASSQPPGRSKK
jgi:hypothetical protein